MPVQPCSYFWLLVGGVVVQDDVDCLVLGHLGLDGIEKADDLLMPVPLHFAADHRSVENIERGKQGRGPVALVVVGTLSEGPLASHTQHSISGNPSPAWVIMRKWYPCGASAFCTALVVSSPPMG